jgi:uncharacterized C2H2 Zn-finger protein
MPRIKVYKGGGHIVPIDVAKIATAFRCPWTKKVYGDKRSYVKHLKWLRETRMHSRIRATARLRKRQDLWNQPTFVDIIKWIEMNPEFMFDNGLRESWRSKDIEKYRDKFWVKITYLNIQWTSSASNSHSCPRNGVTNWGGRDLDKDGNIRPRGYPGFTGRIEYQMSHDIGFGSDIMRQLGIHTGSGGGITNNRYGYSVTFFDADWPGIVSNRVIDLLGDRDWKSIQYGTPNYFKH